MPIKLYGLLFSLYWAQGLPVGFMTHALPVILRAEGVSLAHIGGFGLLMLPWSCKIFWAIWIDKIATYRTWIIGLQLLSIAVLMLLAYFPIEHLQQREYLLIFFLLLFCLNLTGATQDIATDALAVNISQEKQLHWVNSIQVVGSRLGFIVGGGLMLWLLELWSWQLTFWLLAALVAVNTLPIILQNNVDQYQTKNTTKAMSWQQIKQIWQGFIQRTGLMPWLMVLLSFKLADGLSGPLLKPLMVDLGLSFSQIGWYITFLGAVAALWGAIVAAILLKHYARHHMLWVLSWIKLMSLAAYVWLAWQYEHQVAVAAQTIYFINAMEDFCAAMLLVVMLTLVMQYSRKAFAGTDFTLQVAIMATVSGGLYSISGILADFWGYAVYLSIILVIAVLSLYPIWQWKNAINMQN